MSDLHPLAGRTGLPEAMRYLVQAHPRDRWPEPTLHPVARHWLGMHDGFRAHQADMAGMVEDLRAGRIDARGLHPRLIPALGGFLQHLDAHHRIESGHYFPAFRRIEPRIVEGLDLLDRDHDAVHAHLEAMFEAGRDYHEAVLGHAPDVADRAARLAEALDAAAPPLLRHLEDEEDIVIPLLALRGDPTG